jgi:hypothetical protein
MKIDRRKIPKHLRYLSDKALQILIDLHKPRFT